VTALFEIFKKALLGQVNLAQDTIPTAEQPQEQAV
jgi:hypothetical protein